MKLALKYLKLTEMDKHVNVGKVLGALDKHKISKSDLGVIQTTQFSVKIQVPNEILEPTLKALVKFNVRAKAAPNKKSTFITIG